MSYTLTDGVTSFSGPADVGQVLSAAKIGSSTRAGQTRYALHTAVYSKWELPLSFVNSEFMSVVNSWWSVGQSLTLTDQFNDNFTVVITNDSKPISNYIIVHDNLFSGVIKLTQSSQ